MKNCPLASNNYSTPTNIRKMQKSKNKFNRNLIGISLVTVFLLSFGLAEDAFAISAGSEFTPTQPNANVSFDNATKQIQVDWNFTTGGVNAPETCLLKGDFVWYEDLNAKHTSGKAGVDYDKTTGFIPIHYSVVSSNPTVVDTLSEEIPCENGSIRIDIDTIMSHSENINNYEDLEIFLSFYVANADGSLNLADASRIDEVFVMYTPNNVFDDAAYRGYGCGDSNDNGIGNQIGSVLYVDASGSDVDGEPSLIAYGDNGDNCGDHLYLENNEYVDIGPTGSSSPGVAAYGNHAESSYSLLILVVDFVLADSNCGDCTPPTFGLDRNNNLIVTNGFSFNGVAVNVDDYHTEYDKITVHTNQINTVSVKVYEDNGISNIQIVQFGLGMPKLGSTLQDAETLVEIWLENGGIKDVIELDDNNLVTIRGVITGEANCGGYDIECLTVKLQYIYRDQPKYNIMGIGAADFALNSKTGYINDGVNVIGNSLNAPPTKLVTVSHAGAFYPQTSGETTLTLTDYKTDTWTDEYGYIWSTNENGPYIVDDISPPEKRDDYISPWSGVNDRVHSDFDEYVKLQQDKAAKILEKMNIQERNGIKNISLITEPEIFYKTFNRDDLNFTQSLSAEEQKILVVYENQNNPYSGT